MTDTTPQPDGITLLDRARKAGIAVQRNGDHITIGDPERDPELASELIANREMILRQWWEAQMLFHVAEEPNAANRDALIRIFSLNTAAMENEGHRREAAQQAAYGLIVSMDAMT